MRSNSATRHMVRVKIRTSILVALGVLIPLVCQTHVGAQTSAGGSEMTSCVSSGKSGKSWVVTNGCGAAVTVYYCITGSIDEGYVINGAEDIYDVSRGESSGCGRSGGTNRFILKSGQTGYPQGLDQAPVQLHVRACLAPSAEDEFYPGGSDLTGACHAQVTPPSLPSSSLSDSNSNQQQASPTTSNAPRSPRKTISTSTAPQNSNPFALPKPPQAQYLPGDSQCVVVTPVHGVLWVPAKVSNRCTHDIFVTFCYYPNSGHLTDCAVPSGWGGTMLKPGGSDSASSSGDLPQGSSLYTIACPFPQSFAVNQQWDGKTIHYACRKA